MKKIIAAVFFLGMFIFGAQKYRAVLIENERQARIAQAAADLKEARDICDKFGDAQIWVSCMNEVGDSLVLGREQSR